MSAVGRMVIQMYKDQLSDVGAIEVKMDLKSWNPAHEDVDYVIADMEGLAKSQIEDCDEPEWAKETYESIRKIRGSENFNERRSLMQDHLVEMFHAVPVGLIRKYYSNEYASFIEKALGIKYVVMGETFASM